MDKSKIDFNQIANLSCSKRSQSIDEFYTNDKIFLFRDSDYEIDKFEEKKRNKLEFEKIFEQTKKKFISLSSKSEQIINSKDFSFKDLLVNNLNIQSIPRNEQKKDFNMTVNNKNINENNININDNKNMNDIKMINHFKIIEPLNNNYSNNNYILEQSREIENPMLIGNKRKLVNNNNIDIKENEIQHVFNEILIICQKISKLNNNIIIKEEQNGIDSDNDNIETTLIINDNQIITIYFNKNMINKVYDYNNKEYIIKENEILSQLKLIKKKMNSILNKIKK
jgi:hypothetical protein